MIYDSVNNEHQVEPSSNLFRISLCSVAAASANDDE